ncbi:MAG: hypothetical protein FJ399_22565, partial [Verrucomicrobia bacterium]|nr:hypothetical protein [Verrucomicrobiota bacterium]
MQTQGECRPGRQTFQNLALRRAVDEGVKPHALGGALLLHCERVVEMVPHPIGQLIVDQHQCTAISRTAAPSPGHKAGNDLSVRPEVA